MNAIFTKIESVQEHSSDKIRAFVEANDYSKVVDTEFDHFQIVQFNLNMGRNESENYLEFDERFGPKD